MRTELHCHSTASDGALTPTALVALAASRGVQTLALTDHDTLAGHAEAEQACVKHNLRWIPGIEISTLFADRFEVHVLGYGVRPRDTDTQREIDALRGTRSIRAQQILDRLAALGAPIDMAQVQALAGDGIIGRPHIARALLIAGHVSTFNEAFERFLAEGAPAYVPNRALTPAGAIDLIHRAGGCAVLAHPGLFLGDLDALLASMLSAGLDGLEAFHPGNDGTMRKWLLALAPLHGLIVTGGSDYHCDNGHHSVALGDVYLSEEILKSLTARMLQYCQ
jgi:hypothetical protein